MKNLHLDILPILVFVVFLVINLFIKNENVKPQDQSEVTDI
jgi:hypothetical protein